MMTSLLTALFAVAGLVFVALLVALAAEALAAYHGRLQ
jgi:hypothetical protein